MVKHPFRTFKAYGRCVHSHAFAICAQNETHSARRNQGLTDNVNVMAMNLTNQVRSIAEVTKAVAGGDLTKRITVDVRGEMLDLKETVNGMTESLSLFADEVTRVAKEVGTEGLLGGQAQVSNVGGTWKDLTDNVNVMAANVRLYGCRLYWVLTRTRWRI